jgi:drug/metabolite transporter (DMT)-like permease
MIHILGYIALVINLTSMTMKNVIYLRFLSLIANAIYIVYGFFLTSPPLMIGCGIAVVIHGFHIMKLRKEKNSNLKEIVS